MKRKMKKIVNEVKLISFIIMYWVLKKKMDVSEEYLRLYS